jgi:hypothetical protein
MSVPTRIEKMSKSVLLSTLWIWVTVNYIFCDVVTLMNPRDLRNILDGKVGSLVMDEKFLLGASVMMEIPFVMILLSRVLPWATNRWMNVAAGVIMTLVQVSSLFAGTPPTLHYWFFSAMEILGTMVIVWQAWQWKQSAQVQEA